MRSVPLEEGGWPRAGTAPPGLVDQGHATQPGSASDLRVVPLVDEEPDPT